ncbi:MAG: hypothetical protein U9Q69_03055 [Nanoarchaeota archaeon]|nr:hypothetical protein [Nanoarchaeota archaeon]
MKKVEIIARMILEVVGAPKEHIETALQDVINKLKEESKIKLKTSKLFETKQLKNKFWSAFAEVEFSTDDMKTLLEICFDYTPSAIEILEPAGIDIDTQVLASIFNDLLAKVHQFVAVLKNYEAENRLLKDELKKFKK